MIRLQHTSMDKVTQLPLSEIPSPIVHLFMELTLACSASALIQPISCLRILKFGKQLFQPSYVTKGLPWNQIRLGKSDAQGRSEGRYYINDVKSAPRASISALEKYCPLPSSEHVSCSQSRRVTRSDSRSHSSLMLVVGVNMRSGKRRVVLQFHIVNTLDYSAGDQS